MTKQLLLLCAASLSALYASADKITELDWHYGTDPYSCTSMGSSSQEYTEYGFFYVDPDRATQLAGCQVNSITVTNGIYSTLIPKIRYILTESLKSEPILYTAETRITKSTTKKDSDGYTVIDTWKTNTQKLSTPYTIKAGQGFYVGISFVEQTATNYPIVFDNVPTSKYKGFLGARVETGTDLEDIVLKDYTEKYGALAISINISGDNVPQQDVSLVSVSTTDQVVAHNQSYNATMTFINSGAQPISSITYKYKNGNGAEKTATFTPSSPIEFGKSDACTLQLSYDKAGVIPVTAEVVSVNGVADEFAGDNAATGRMLVYDSSKDSSYARNVLGEEFTGTWCGWCPRGYVGMEYMRDTYTDGSWVGIAIHAGYSKEPMYNGQFSDVTSEFCYGYPEAVINRKTANIIDPNQSDLESYYKSELAIGAPVQIELTANHNDENVYITSKSTFAFDINPGDFKIEYVLREDNVGPYDQTNYYAGGSYGTMGGFESLSSSTSLMFNDVGIARKVYSDPFADGGIAKTAIVHHGRVPIPEGANIENTKAIAIITGPNSYIANAKINMQYSSVDDIAADDSKFTPTVNDGTLTVGDVDAEVYTISGQHVANIRANDSINLSAGLYIVRAEGKASKIVVK